MSQIPETPLEKETTAVDGKGHDQDEEHASDKAEKDLSEPSKTTDTPNQNLAPPIATTNEITSNLPAVNMPELHPLHCKWAWWFLKGDRSKDWEDCLKPVASFDKIEEFWSLYNFVVPASGLSFGSDYYIFKEGIKPMWEDSRNVNGGRWLVVVEKAKGKDKVDEYWLDLLMAMLGEQFDELGDLICGAVVNIRQKGDKVALWTRDATLDDANMKIGQILKAKLGIPDNEPIRYEVHKDSAARTGSSVKPRFVIPANNNTAAVANGNARTRRISGNHVPIILPNVPKSKELPA